MTATSAGSSSCLTAKGLDISLAALQRQDPYINNIVDVASQVALYTYNNRANEWEKTEVEGTLFIYTRLASPRHGFTIMNRLSMENLTEPITKDLDFQLQDPFLLYRNARLVIHGIWFYDKEDCQRIAQRMKILTQQEQALAQSQGGWLSPGGGGGGGGIGGLLGGGGGGGGGTEAKGVDIIQMLTKARTEYDKEKSTSEPKEIGGSSVLCGNPNLIKPIPVKPNAQDNDGAEPKSLSLAALFGSQPQPYASPKSPPPPAAAAPPMGSSPGKATRPPVARTLTYDDSLNSGRGVTSNGGNPAPAGISDGGTRASAGEDCGKAASGLLLSPSAAQPQPNAPQHCPAIAKLMQGQRAVGGVLQTLSESPENRLCDNGAPLEHHHHHLYHLHHQQQLQQHHHAHHHHQLHPDPIKRLFQSQPAPPPPPNASFCPPAPSFCPSLPHVQQQNPHLPSQPVMNNPVSCSHLQPQSQPLFLSLSKSQAESQQSSQTAPAARAAGLLPAQVTSDQAIQPPLGLSSHMQGVVSPHELLQKLQLVQQEQSLASQEPPRFCPGLAPRFLGPSQNPGAAPAPNAATAGQKAALQFQVTSPERIPATVAPTMLLSPSVFAQTKPGGGMPAAAQDNCPAAPSSLRPPSQDETRVLSRSQLQATLVHLIQTDSSFLDSIYEAYVSRFVSSSGSKY
ncbi:LOW QUALITY PROTEIN: mRNA-decapping enzyme 1B [Salarias fasciatus]|uniref:LOW QUALITY PROTEIN: mRNA-decapping enzyme 1B n=1 Tax=Salarias fasciatus TaxID=181472 RepID=UPI001176910B|nr:LOW QUALITY PROTEIN: mRNA-decapping enzyme 1B-like [Salarias fasciatus]